MVLAASGVEHEELVSIAEPLLSDLPKVARPEEPKSVYVGGDNRCQADSDVCINKLYFVISSLGFCGNILISNCVYTLLVNRRHILLWLLKFLAAGIKKRML